MNPVISSLTRQFSCLVALCASLSNLIHAQQPSETELLLEVIVNFEGTYISRPSHSSGSFTSSISKFQMDGFEGQYMELKGNKISLKGSVLNDWQEDKSKASKYSIAFKYRFNPKLNLTFSLLEKSKFLPSTDTDNVIAYLSGIYYINRDRFKVFPMDPMFRDKGFMSHLFQKETLNIDYGIRGRAPTSGYDRYFTYLVELESNWLEISLSGPEEDVSRQLAWFKRTLRNYSVMKPDGEKK